MQSFEFEIQCRPGERLAHVDFLSRNPISKDRIKSKGTVEKHINLTGIIDNWLLAEQQRDEETSSIVSNLRDDDISGDLAKTYELRAGALYRKIQRSGKTRCLSIIPKLFRWSAVNNVHESIMHLGWLTRCPNKFANLSATVLHANCQSPHLVGYKPNCIPYRRLTSRGIQSSPTSQGS